MKLNKLAVLASLIGTGLLTTQAHANDLQSLQNMERERAELIETFRDADLSPEHRHTKVHAQQNRLVDLERLVLRDDRLLGHKDRLVRLTFDNYELSFLVHASAEAKTAPVEHWMKGLGFDTRSLLNTTVGRR